MKPVDIRRSVRTLAWLGDAEFEREVRHRVARRGDFSTDRLDAVKALVVCAPAQAALLEAIATELDDVELALIRRARNARPPASAKTRRISTRTYRAATALEALVGAWRLGDEAGSTRFEEILVPSLERAIDEAFRRTTPRR